MRINQGPNAGHEVRPESDQFGYDGLVQTLRGALVKAREKLNEQHDELMHHRELIDTLTQGPYVFAQVLYLRDWRQEQRGSGLPPILQTVMAGIHPPYPEDRQRGFANVLKRHTAVVFLEGRLMEIGIPTDLPVVAGDTIRINVKTSTVVDIVDEEVIGEIAVVTTKLDVMTCEVQLASQSMIVFVGQYGDLEPGDRVVIDASHNVVIRRLSNEGDAVAAYGGPNVSWDDIGGQEDGKRALQEAIELPYRHAALYAKYGRKPCKGILLHGPSGCGKTLLARAAATSIAMTHGAGAARTGFIGISATEILNKWVGESEAKIRELFARARRHRQRFGFPAVIFIDEADAVLRQRGGSTTSHMESTLVPTFLAEMDGLASSDAIVILATNLPNALDPAIVRDGRIDVKVKVDRPNQATAASIFAIHLRDKPLAGRKSEATTIAEAVAAELFSDRQVLTSIKLPDGSDASFALRHVCNGAMIKGIVDGAIAIAMRRDIASASGKACGVRSEDLIAAVTSCLTQNAAINHGDAFREFITNLGVELQNAEPATPAPANPQSN